MLKGNEGEMLTDETNTKIFRKDAYWMEHERRAGSTLVKMQSKDLSSQKYSVHNIGQEDHEVLRGLALGDSELVMVQIVTSIVTKVLPAN